MSSPQLPSLTVQLITVSLLTLQREFNHLDTTSRNSWLESYDYIVVGSGSAGAVVAARLSEDSGVNVILLEAGGPQTSATDIPMLYTDNFVDSSLFWSTETAPQRYTAQSYVNQTIFTQSGRVLGGTSTVNGLLYNRGNRRSYDEWVNSYGAKGWSYEQVLPYFRKAENNTDPIIVARNALYHGVDGPVQVSSPLDPDPVLLAFQDTANQLGYPTVDFNAETQLGTMICQKTITRNGVRASTANAYLEPNRRRNNLHIISRAFVTKILFRNIDGKQRAIGVSFTRDNKQNNVYAKREVIISAGAINSAQLLMLSGIGPQSHLRQMGIPVVADLPVGDNLQDHPLLILNYFVNNISYTRNSDDLTVQSLYEYYTYAMSPLSFFREGSIYLNSKLNTDKQWPDIFMSMSVDHLSSNLSQLVSPYATNLDEWRNYYRPYVNTYQWLEIYIRLFKPRSRGTVRLSSRNPYDQPIIQPNYLADAIDLEAFVDGVAQVIEITQNANFSKYAQPFAAPIPGCYGCPSLHLRPCREYLRCVVRSVGTSDTHFVGTARMGSADDSSAVVDERLRVKNVSALRVIDGSIMPRIVNSNVNAAIIMIGEYGSQMIKDDNC